MPREMRFCRLCGYRLGEGVAEYAETVRLDNNANPARNNDVSPPFAQQASYAQGTASATDSARRTPFSSFGEMGGAANLAQQGQQSALHRMTGQVGMWKPRRAWRAPWYMWMIIALVVTSAAGGGTAFRFHLGGSGNHGSHASVPDSRIGIDNLDEANGGVTFDKATPPGSPADKAGLVGGDTITSFDGKPVKTVDQLKSMLRMTPVGKTVEVVYLRDGETKTTTMTTISGDESDRLDSQFDDRREGEGFIGEGTDLERVPVPGMNIYGVKLNDIGKKNSAYISGLRDGDIVIEFGGVPTRTRRELESRITRAEPGSTVKTVVVRGSERVEIPVRITGDDD
jgi:membrane-associated protease RseP (regulator of RpoE activity)